MAEADTQTTDRCKALTESGERCSRPARGDGFCYQHDESDPIADAASAEDETGDGSETTDESTEGSDVSETETTDIDAVDTDEIDVDVDEEKIEAVLTVRRTVESTASELIGRPFDGVTEIESTEEGWRGVVEVVERSSIPDTQDILGRYAIDLTEDGTIEGYHRLDRYRRDDTTDRH